MEVVSSTSQTIQWIAFKKTLGTSDNCQGTLSSCRRTYDQQSQDLITNVMEEQKKLVQS
jgi:hypothetical protein